MLVWVFATGVHAQRDAVPADDRSKRPVEVQDAVEMTQIGDSDYLSSWAVSGKVALFSPDGAYFVFLTQKGDLKTNTVEYSLWLFKSGEALTSSRPTLLARMASSSNRPAVSHVQWLPDSDGLVFLGEMPDENPQLYRVRASDLRLVRLTHSKTPIIQYSMAEDGTAFIYVAEIPPQPLFSDEMLRQGFFVSPQQHWEELYTNRRQWESRYQVYIKTPTMEEPRRIGQGFNINLGTLSYGLDISPDGKYALFPSYVPDPPEQWEQYGFKSYGDLVPLRSACLEGEIYRCPQQYQLVDLEHETVQPLLDVPIVWGEMGLGLAIYTRDSSVILVNSLLPLDAVKDQERERLRKHLFAVEVTLPSRKINEIAEMEKPFAVSTIRRSTHANELLAKPLVETFGPMLSFQRRRDGRWSIVEAGKSEDGERVPLSVTLEQGINEPPRLVAAELGGKRKRLLLDLNPQFRRLTFGRVEMFRWKNKEGDAAEGSLYYPPDYVQGKKYPLVIQTHGESRDWFWIDGPFSTANAAQPLANASFLVLQIGFGDRYDKAWLDRLAKVVGTPDEAPYFVSFAESAIDELDRRGLIDRNRVGMTGFSRTVYYTEYFLTHSDYPLAAAVVADGMDYSYGGCVLLLGPAFASICENVNGGPPFGASLSNWAQRSPMFRLNRLRTPMLLQSISGPLGEWELLAGLRWLRKPVELVNFYPKGEHILVLPRQRLLSQQSVVDWYRFWLKGEEDPEPSKVNQYRRWRKLRELQDTNLKTVQTEDSPHAP